jgi:hypothetical protein
VRPRQETSRGIPTLTEKRVSVTAPLFLDGRECTPGPATRTRGTPPVAQV